MAAQTIRVAPVEGRALPLEANPRRRVDREMDVPNTRYYRHAIRKGDLTKVEPRAKASRTTTTAKASPEQEG